MESTVIEHGRRSSSPLKRQYEKAPHLLNAQIATFASYRMYSITMLSIYTQYLFPECEIAHYI